MYLCLLFTKTFTLLVAKRSQILMRSEQGHFISNVLNELWEQELSCFANVSTKGLGNITLLGFI